MCLYVHVGFRAADKDPVVPGLCVKRKRRTLLFHSKYSRIPKYPRTHNHGGRVVSVRKLPSVTSPQHLGAQRHLWQWALMSQHISALPGWMEERGKCNLAALCPYNSCVNMFKYLYFKASGQLGLGVFSRTIIEST